MQAGKTIDFNRVNAMLGESVRTTASLVELLRSTVGDDVRVSRLQGCIRRELRELEFLVDSLPEAYTKHGQRIHIGAEG